jgi:type 1 glutamine amidotransferase
VAGGGRWFALHGTNSVLDLTPEGVASPRVIPVLAQTLGSQFIAHPPISPYRVEVTQPDHPLVKGVDPFDTSDELYLSELHGEIQTLLHTSFSGEAKGFIESAWTDDRPRPVMYLHPVGSGEVLYLTLGHCRGHFDMRPTAPWWPSIDRGAWETEEYRVLLRRGISWVCGEEPATDLS